MSNKWNATLVVLDEQSGAEQELKPYLVLLVYKSRTIFSTISI